MTTHRHPDHWQALPSVAAAKEARLICGQHDLEAISTGASVAGMIGVWDGDHVELGSERLEVIGLVGHTPGSITLSYEGPASRICSLETACFPVDQARPTLRGLHVFDE